MMWQGNYNGLECTVRYLSISDIPLLERVQQTVLETLPEKDLYQPLTTEEFVKLVTDRTIIGAFIEKELIAFRALLIPPLDEEHLGRDIGYSNDKLGRILYQEVSNVHPSYRGYRLQSHLGRLLMEEWKHDNRFDLICATVAPFNIASMKDKFMLGLRIGALKQKYGGKTRYIFLKELHEDWLSSGDKIWIEMDDYAGQVDLIESGWFGTGIQLEEDQWFVKYEKGHI